VSLLLPVATVFSTNMSRFSALSVKIYKVPFSYSSYMGEFQSGKGYHLVLCWSLCPMYLSNWYVHSFTGLYLLNRVIKGSKILCNVNTLLLDHGVTSQKTAILKTDTIFPAVGLQNGWCSHNHPLDICCFLYYVWNPEMCWEAEGQC